LEIQVEGNVTIAKSTLSKLTALNSLFIQGSIEKLGNVLTIKPAALNLPQLTQFDISYFDLTPASIQALEAEKDRLSSLSISDSILAGEILNETSKFTNLTEMVLVGMRYNGSITESTFKNSAATLKKLFVSSCDKPMKLTADLFRGMSKLTELSWRSNLIRLMI
jgi:hypothetical protein